MQTANVAPPRDRDGFEIAIVCALKLERDAVEALMEVDFKERGRTYGKDGQDRNAYTTGVLGGKAVVLAYPRDMGTLNAATVASDMRFSFKNIKMCLVVGITGGAPRTPDGSDILLGDIIISTAVIQLDFGRQHPNGFKRKSAVENTLGRANPEIANFLALLAGDRATRRLATKTSEYGRASTLASKFAHPGLSPGCLFPSGYRHKHQDPQKCAICSNCTGWDDPVCDEAERASCKELKCDERALSHDMTDAFERTPGGGPRPQEALPANIHFGRVASSNGVMKSGVHRDKLMASEEVIAFEMEGAGTWDQLPTVVVKSVCDHADSHKNKAWQGYAAATAASCAKAILEEWEESDVAKTQTVHEAPGRSPVPSVHLPFTRNRRFVGRTAELEALERKLLVEQDCQKAAIVGLGGIGKTQVALSFAYSVLDKYPDLSVFWVPALSAETFERAFEEIARMLGIDPVSNSKEDVKRLVQRQLGATAAGKWLLIVDNADDMDILEGTGATEGLLDYLPESSLGLILFTTRNDKVAQSLVGSDVIEMEKMEWQEAMDLLEQSLVRKELLGETSTAAGLLDELDNLPLAITQAAAYMRINRVSTFEYLELLRSTEENMVHIMSTEIRDSTRYRRAANAVATTWIVSFKQVVEQDGVAADLLRYMSCIEWKAIPHSILPGVQPEARMTSAIGTLCAYAFLTKRQNKKVYDMHRLVHLAIRIWNSQHGDAMETRKRAMLHLAEVFPPDDYMKREIWREYLPHVARIHKDTVGGISDGKATICLKVGKCLLVDGKIKEAVFWLEESCYKTKELSKDHPLRLVSQHELARAYQANGQIKEAVKLLEHVVTIREEVLVEDHPNRLSSQHELAGAYKANGQIKEAVKLLEHVVTIQGRVLAEDHPNRLASQHELARAYEANGQVKEAVKLLEHVVTIQDRVLAEDHPNRLVSQHELAGAYEANGQIKEAVKLLEHVVTIQDGVLAEDHPNRLASQHELAGAYEANGQIKEAVKLLEHVVTIQGRVLAEDHPNRLNSQHELARAYKANGQVKEAVKLLEHVVTIKDGVLAEDHPDRLASQHVLAGAYQANGQVKEAVKLLEHVVTIKDRVLAEDHPLRLVSQHELARVYEANGQIKEAVKLLEHVVTIQDRVLAEDHPNRLASQHELAGAYKANGQIKEAVKLLEHVVTIQDRVLAEDHPNRLASQHELARAYQANGQIKEAVKLLEYVVTIRKEVLVEDHPNRLNSQHELVGAYKANGQIKEAVKLLEHVVTIQGRVLAEDHPNRLASQHELARAYQANGQVKEAVKLLEHVVTIKDRVLAEDHPNRLTLQHVLAGAYQANGQVKEAVKLLEHVVTIEEGVLAEDHPDRLTSQHVLAIVYLANGQVKEAVKLLEHVVTIREEVLV